MRIRDYEISGLLGEGGMGRVYAARHVRLDEPVALKELCIDDPDVAAQFLDEARVLYTVRHPCFPTVKDCFVHGGRHYLVMDRIAGGTLQSEIDRTGRVAPNELGWIVDQLLEGLEYLHERGVIHRDIKPSNVMVDRTAQRTVLVDFGIARSRASGGHTVAFVRTALTPHFAPPEQYRGEPSARTADLYQLGATAYYAATGVLPPESIARAPIDPLIDIALLAPQLDPRRAAIVRAALMLEPARRPESAGAIRATWNGVPNITTSRPVSARALDTYRRLGALDIRRRP